MTTAVLAVKAVTVILEDTVGEWYGVTVLDVTDIHEALDVLVYTPGLDWTNVRAITDFSLIF